MTTKSEWVKIKKVRNRLDPIFDTFELWKIF